MVGVIARSRPDLAVKGGFFPLPFICFWLDCVLDRSRSALQAIAMVAQLWMALRRTCAVSKDLWCHEIPSVWRLRRLGPPICSPL